MATKKAAVEELNTANESQSVENAEQVTIPKNQLDAIMAQLDETNKKVEELTKQANQQGATKQALEEAKEKELLIQIEEANSNSEELVEVYIDKGSLKSNKNLEVNACGKQFVIPKGKTVQVPRFVKEVIDNADKQMEEALHLQEKRVEETEKAMNEGGLSV